MTLQTIDFPFVSGTDESIDSRVLPAPKLVRAENLRIDKSGRLQKCKGTSSIAANAPTSPSPTPRGPVRLFNHEDQLCAFGESSLWTYSPEADQLEELDFAPATTLEYRRSLGHYGARNVVARGAATISAFTVYAWVVADDTDPSSATDLQLHVLTLDNQTGAGNAATVVPMTSSSVGAAHLKVIPVNGTKITILWGETQAGPTYVVRYMDVTSATAGPYTSAQGDVLASGADITDPQWFDACPHGTGYLMAYFNGTTVRIDRYNSSHVSQANTTASFTGASPRVQVCGDFSNYGGATCSLVILSTTNAFVRRYDDAMSTQGTYDAAYSASIWDNSGVTGVAAVPYEHSSGSYDKTALFFSVETAGGQKYSQVYYVGSSDTLDASTSEIVDAYVIAKPWQYDDDLFLPVAYYTTSQANSHCAVLRSDPAFGESRGLGYCTPELRVLAGQASTIAPDDPSATVAVSGTSVKLAFPMLDRYGNPDVLVDPTGVATASEDPDVSATGTQVITVIGCDAYELRMAARDRFMTAKVNGTTYVGGGVVQAFDGKRLFEMGFWSYPDIVDSDLSVSATGGNLADGTYTYGHVWEWVDYQGNVHWSAPKITQVTVSSGTGTAKVTIDQGYELSQTGKHWRLQGDDDRPVTLVHYATAVNGSLLHRLEGSGVAAFTENSIGSVSNTLGNYEDTYDRATIELTTRELLYATSFGRNELWNEAPPPSRFIVAHDGRLFGINDEDPTQVWYSKLSYPGVGIAWNRSLVIQFEAPVKALASQDGNLIAFTEHDIYTVVGRGADNTGGTTSYEPPQLLSSDRGCVNPRSVASVPGVGIFFESDRGLEVLPRGGSSVEYVGDPISDTLATYPSITDAHHDSAAGEVLFACMTSEAVGATGRILAYDYQYGQWFVRTRTGAPISSMAELSGSVVYGIYDNASAMTLWQEYSGFDEGDSTFITWTVETGDIRLGGLFRDHRINDIFVLLEVLGVETLRIRESVDSGETWTTYRTKDFDTVTNVEGQRYTIFRPKAPQHRFELSSTTSGGTVDSEGIAINGIQIHGTQIRGRASLASTLEM